MRSLPALLLLSTALFTLACGSDPATGSGGAGGDGGSTNAGGSTSTGGGDGCERGLVRCDGACVDIATDNAHCGACGQACGADEICNQRQCKDGAPFCAGEGTVGLQCGDACVFKSYNLDHCGGCDQPCDATSYCKDGVCAPKQGDGSSCASPIVLSNSGNFSADFWFPDNGASMVLSCGALDPRPTVTFRWTADQTKDGFKFKIEGAKTDDLVLEAFSAAPCGAATSLGCNNDETATQKLPELQMAVESGKTYFIVVAPFGSERPKGRFGIHIDD